MKRNLYTPEEIILCAFIARFGRGVITESTVHKIKDRSLSSIKMKVQNIASMLHEENIPYSNEVSVLTGLPQGETGRKTNWDIVSKIIKTSKEEHKKLCLEILNNKS